MPSSPAESDEYCEYFCGCEAITCRVLYRTEQLVFVQFRTVDWSGYRDFSKYARVALFSEHLRPADPQSPGVVNFAQAIAREVTAQQQHLANCRRAREMGIHTVKSNQANGQEAPAPKSNGVKPLPKPAKPPVRERKGRASGEDVHSLKPVRSIGGLTLADFLYDR